MASKKRKKFRFLGEIGDVFAVKSPDYPDCLPAFRSTQNGDRNALDVRDLAFGVAETAAWFGVREEVFQNNTLIWQSLNCRPAEREGAS